MSSKRVTANGQRQKKKTELLNYDCVMRPGPSSNCSNSTRDSLSVTSDDTVQNGNFVLSKCKSRKRKAAGSVTYVDSSSRTNFEDLWVLSSRFGVSVLAFRFYNILPYVSPTYTKLCNPPMPNLIGVDTDQEWLRNLSASRLNDFLDVSEKEKEFFALWNSFVTRRENRVVGRIGLPFLLERFVRAHRDTVANQNLLFNFISHCVHLCRCGYITSRQMYDICLPFESCVNKIGELSNNQEDKKKESSQLTPRRSSPRKQSLSPLKSSSSLPQKNVVLNGINTMDNLEQMKKLSSPSKLLPLKNGLLNGAVVGPFMKVSKLNGKLSSS